MAKKAFRNYKGKGTSDFTTIVGLIDDKDSALKTSNKQDPLLWKKATELLNVRIICLRLAKADIVKKTF